MPEKQRRLWLDTTLKSALKSYTLVSVFLSCLTFKQWMLAWQLSTHMCLDTWKGDPSKLPGQNVQFQEHLPQFYYPAYVWWVDLTMIRNQTCRLLSNQVWTYQFVCLDFAMDLGIYIWTLTAKWFRFWMSQPHLWSIQRHRNIFISLSKQHSYQVLVSLAEFIEALISVCMHVHMCVFIVCAVILP